MDHGMKLSAIHEGRIFGVFPLCESEGRWFCMIGMSRGDSPGIRMSPGRGICGLNPGQNLYTERTAPTTIYYPIKNIF
jgi:hypothetical protein